MKTTRIAITISMILGAWIGKAQFVNNSAAITVNGGWTAVNVINSDRSSGGYNISGAFEHAVGYSNKLTAGFAFDYFNFGVDLDTVNVYYKTTPFTMKVKTYFGSETFNGYIGGDIGFQTTRIEYGQTSVRDYDFGLAMGLGAGVNKYLAERFFLNAGYNMKWLQNADYRNGLTHTFSVGLGYHFSTM